MKHFYVNFVESNLKGFVTIEIVINLKDNLSTFLVKTLGNRFIANRVVEMINPQESISDVFLRDYIHKVEASIRETNHPF